MALRKSEPTRQLTPAQRRWLARRAAEAPLPPILIGIHLRRLRVIPNADGRTVTLEPIEDANGVPGS